jgi:FkbM family methyltransferase
MKDLILGNKLLQPFFEMLFKVAVKGMNHDRGHVPGFSGEKYVLQLVQERNAGRPLTIFDVGANTGQYAGLVVDNVRSTYDLYSFEPQEQAFLALRTVTDRPSFYPIHVAMGAEAGKTKLFYEQAGSVFASMFPASYDNYNVCLDKSVETEVTTVDDFCLHRNVGRIDLLKIDVEGYEIEVLKGCRQMLADGNIELIQFEFGLASIEARIFMKDFFNLLPQYDIYRILQNGIRKVQYSEYAELFLTTNYLAVRK